MKVSFVLTVGAVLGGLLVGPGCLKHSLVNVQPLGEQVALNSPRPSSPPLSVPVQPVSVPARPDAASFEFDYSSIIPVSAPLMPVSVPVKSISNPVRSASTEAPGLITEAPPQPLVEVVRTNPDSDYAWIPGHWKWQNQWVWSPGGWAAVPRPNAAWIQGRWVFRSGGWVWIRGYWR